MTTLEMDPHLLTGKFLLCEQLNCWLVMRLREQGASLKLVAESFNSYKLNEPINLF